MKNNKNYAKLPPKVGTSRVHKFVIDRCECGKPIFVNVFGAIAKEHFIFQCADCGKRTNIPIQSLVHAKYDCPKCKHKSDFWLRPGSSIEVRCKKCKDDIMLEYDKQSNTFAQK